MGVNLEADVSANIAAALGGMSAKLSSISKTLERLDNNPTNFAMAGSVVGNGGAATIILPGPPMGYYWDLRRIGITGPDPTVVVAGVGYLYAGLPSVANSGQPQMGLQWLDKAASIPLPAFYSTSQVVCHYPEIFFFVVTGSTVNVSYQVTGAGVQYKMADFVEVAT